MGSVDRSWKRLVYTKVWTSSIGVCKLSQKKVWKFCTFTILYLTLNSLSWKLKSLITIHHHFHFVLHFVLPCVHCILFKFYQVLMFEILQTTPRSWKTWMFAPQFESARELPQFEFVRDCGRSLELPQFEFVRDRLAEPRSDSIKIDSSLWAEPRTGTIRVHSRLWAESRTATIRVRSRS